MNNKKWTTTITADSKDKTRLKDLWKCKYLIFLFVRRNFVVKYKQTILGPLWAIIQPLSTTLVFTLIFGFIANLSTDGIPQFLYYMSGNILWSFLATNVLDVSNVFINNSYILKKVYFPRMAMPISIIFSNMISLFIQFILFIIIYVFVCFFSSSISINPLILTLPIFLLQLMLLSLGCGLLISSFTTKYKDLCMVVPFILQLWMYLTPIAYSTSLIPEKWLFIYMLNPVSSIIEVFRYSFFSIGNINLIYIITSFIITILILLLGLFSFNKVEKGFADTI